MGVQVKLVMVGPYKGVTRTFKNVPFTNGVGFVRGPEDKIMHILKYLKGYGAYPANEAEAAQLEVDKFLASQGDTEALKKRKANLKAQMDELEKLEAAVVPAADTAELPAADPAVETSVAPPPADPPTTEGENDEPVPIPETPEGRSGQQAQGGKNSGKQKGRRNG